MRDRQGGLKGEGLGNQFLENIRQTDAIVHVVRAFDDTDITSVSGKVDPIEDIDTINLELVMADLDAVNKRLAKVQRAAKGRDKEALAELEVLNRSSRFWKMVKACVPSNSTTKNKKSSRVYSC
mgnify:CR=1 FL=1